MPNFNLILPRKIVFGAGRLAELGTVAAPLGRRAILVTGRGAIEQSGKLKAVQSQLDAAGIAWRHVTAAPEPTAEQLVQLYSGVEDFAADSVIAIGAAARSTRQGAGRARHQRRRTAGLPRRRRPRQKIERPALPVVAVPTTPAPAPRRRKTRSSATRRTRSKKASATIRDAGVALVDPEFLPDSPPAVIAACGMDRSRN